MNSIEEKNSIYILLGKPSVHLPSCFSESESSCRGLNAVSN